jgi:hypothetical protein
MGDRIRLSRDDLFTPEVDDIVSRQEALQRAAPDMVATSAWRRVVMSSLFFLAVAGTLGGLLGWLVLEPMVNEAVEVWGEIDAVGLPSDVDMDGVEIQVKGMRVLVDHHTSRVVGEGGFGRVAGAADLKQGQPVRVQAMVVDASSGTLFATRVTVGEIPEHRLQEPRPDLARQQGLSLVSGVFAFAVVGACIAGLIAAADGLVSRNPRRGLLSGACGVGLAAVGGLVLLIPGSLVFGLTMALVDQFAEGMWTTDTLRGVPMLILVVGRSLTWGVFGLCVGLGQGVAQRSMTLFVNGLLGGALGGLVGGALFDPISKVLANTDLSGQALISRGVGFAAIGLAAGLMIGLVEQLSKDAWLQLRAGPLAGKEFIIYTSPMTLGSSPKSEIYLFKDPEVEPRHAHIRIAGARHEVVDLGGRSGTWVNGQRVRRQILHSGDRLTIGETVLEYVRSDRRDPR